MHKFKTKVIVDICDSFGIYRGDGECEIEWELDFELRSYGVKDLSITVPKQTITTTITIYDDGTDEDIEKEITVNLEDVEVSGYFNNLENTIVPDRLEIYYNTDIVLKF